MGAISVSSVICGDTLGLTRPCHKMPLKIPVIEENDEPLSPRLTTSSIPPANCNVLPRSSGGRVPPPALDPTIGPFLDCCRHKPLSEQKQHHIGVRAHDRYSPNSHIWLQHHLIDIIVYFYHIYISSASFHSRTPHCIYINCPLLVASIYLVIIYLFISYSLTFFLSLLHCTS